MSEGHTRGNYFDDLRLDSPRKIKKDIKKDPNL